MKQVIVVGGGAAGMLAAIAAAENGNKVILLEANEKLGKKIYITGKGRCNITNLCDTEDLFRNIPRNPKFLYSAIYMFDNFQIIDLLEKYGCKTKQERGNRAFPVSDHSSDVIKALQKAMEELGVTICLNTKVKGLYIENNTILGVVTDKKHIFADAVILATGGLSYPSTGSTGDGIRFAKDCGHECTALLPSLVPFETREKWVKDVMGLALKNVEAKIYDENNKLLFSEFGEMLFTHFGVSGPLMLTASSSLNDAIQKGPLQLKIDLKPALDFEKLDKRLLKEFDDNKNKSFKNVIGSLFPASLIPVMISLSDIPENTKVCDITKSQREAFVSLMKNVPLTLIGTRGFAEAIVTRGGISVKDINPSTMESKKIKNLYFAGEMIDCDAYTGGFNLQIAWSTGHLAGASIE